MTEEVLSLQSRRFSRPLLPAGCHLYDDPFTSGHDAVSGTETVKEWQAIGAPLDVNDRHVVGVIPLLKFLRQARDWKIGLALLQEGILPLLAFFGHVVEHCCITSQFLNTREAVGVRVEGSF